jgi:hypothetical protein
VQRVACVAIVCFTDSSPKNLVEAGWLDILGEMHAAMGAHVELENSRRAACIAICNVSRDNGCDCMQARGWALLLDVRKAMRRYA